MTHTERRQQWKARVESYRANGLSKKEFCKQHNISVKQLYYWLKKESIKEEQANNAIKWLQVNLNIRGRKNWLFSNMPKGPRASATIYSIVETAKENGLNPFEYLKYLFEKLPNMDIEDKEALDEILP